MDRKSRYIEAKRRERYRRKRIRDLQMKALCAISLIAIVLVIKGVTANVQASLEPPEESVAGTGENISMMENVIKRVMSESRKTVVIDPGHGGNDPGCMANNETIIEKDINLQIALKLQTELEERGYHVIMTRTSDKFIELEDRAQTGSQDGVHAFVSIHQNILENDSNTNGIETWYNEDTNEDSALLAGYVQEAAVKATGAYSHGTKETDELHVTNATLNPACLIETGFLSNLEERKNLLDSSYQKKLAAGIAEGIDQFVQAVSKETGTTQ